VAFLNGGQQVDNTSFYSFNGAGVGSLFNLSSGSISFNLKSRYSFATRKTISTRWVFDVYDANNDLFSFYDSTYSGYLLFNYNVGSTSTNTYFVPVGQEDALFGAGVVLNVRISWAGSHVQLFFNNILVQTSTYAPAAPNWSTASSFLIGAKQDRSYGPGWFSCDDWISEFVLSGPPPMNPPPKATSPAPPNTATGISTIPMLSWAASQGATGYDVYVGQSSLATVSSNQASTAYAPGTLAATTTYMWRVDAKNSAGTTTGDVWTFTTAAPPPGKATNPSPTGGSTGVPVATTLSWGAGTGAAAYDVYLAAGTTLPTSPTAANVTGTSWTPPANLYLSTLYSWRIDTRSVSGTTKGDVWTFTTIAAPPPPPPAANPSPMNLATNIGVTTSLIWAGSGQATSYDVYLGTSLPSTPTAAGVTSTSYTPHSALAYSTQYSWRVDAKNAGGTTQGPVWTFTTGAAPGVTTISVNASADAPIHSLAPTTHYGSTSVATMYSGSEALYQFALPTLPTGAVVLSATLQLHDSGYDDGYPTTGAWNSLGIYRVTRSWTESGVTYNNATSATTWTSPGGDFDSTTDFGHGPNGLVAEALSLLSRIPETLTFDVTALVTKQYANTYPNFGFLIAQTARNGGPMLCFRESADATKWPTLVINYAATTVAPSLITATPANGATNAAADASITFTLQDQVGIDPTSLSLVVNGVQHAADVRLSGAPASPTLTYAPSTVYGHSTTVSATLTIRNLAGNTLSTGTAFTTAPTDTVPPAVALAFPSNGTANVPGGTTFAFALIDRDSGVNRTSVSVKLNGTDITSAVQFVPTNGGYQLNYTPPSPLPAGQSATFVLNACDTATNCMAPYVNQVTIAPTAQWVRGAIHQHTGDYSWDASPASTISTGVNAVMSFGDQFLVFAQHQYADTSQSTQWTPAQLQSMAAAEVALGSSSFAVVGGQEVFTTMGHTVLFGVNWDQNPREPYDMQQYATSQGGIFAFAHPEYTPCPCLPTTVSAYRFLADPLYVSAFTSAAWYTSTHDGWSTAYGFLNAGGWYDQMLSAGRKVFMVGESDYHVNATTAGPTNLLLYGPIGPSTVMDAFRSGRLYISDDPALTIGFSVNGYPSGSDLAVSGDLSLTVNVSATMSSGAVDQVTVIRDNSQLFTASPAAASFSQQLTPSILAGQRSYFRLVVVGHKSTGQTVKAITNPIFVGQTSR
jgi:hypothetical protein